eukprot:6540950-Karenia_brevis.AAC.1
MESDTEDAFQFESDDLPEGADELFELVESDGEREPNTQSNNMHNDMPNTVESESDESSPILEGQEDQESE